MPLWKEDQFDSDDFVDDNPYRQRLRAEQDSDIEADERANEEWLENEEELTDARSEFRNRVRQELGLELLPPSKRQKMNAFSIVVRR